MTGLVDWLSGQLAAHPVAVAAMVLLLAFCQALFLLGRYVPGGFVLLAVSAAAGAAGQELWLLFAAATVGTLLGHLATYLIGREAGRGIEGWAPVRRRAGVFQAAEDRFARKRTAALAFARFVPRVRTLMPAVAGMEGMGLPRFLLVDGIAGVVWAALHVFGAGLLGAAVAEAGGRLAAALVAVLIVLALALWLARLAASVSLAWIGQVRRSAHRFVAARDGRAARLLAVTLDPDDLTGLLVLLWASVLFVGLYIFAELMGDVWKGEEIVAADLALNRFVQSFRSPTLDTVMMVITMMGDALVLTAVAAAALGFLLLRRAWWIAGAFLAGVLLPLASVPLVKGILARERPLVGLYSGVDSFSFPSGHATNSMVVLGLCAVLATSALAGARRWITVGLCLLLPLAIAFSRIYLQAHWPSDVAAGLAFALAIVAAFILVLAWLPSGEFGARGFAAVVAATLILAGGANIAAHIGKARVSYAPHDLTEALSEEAWRDGGWRTIDRGRVDFEGDVETPFFLQWVGDTGALDAALRADGWTPSPPWTLSSLGLFAGGGDPATLPVVPEVHLGRVPDETWIKPAEGATRDVFRLWRSHYTVSEAQLYVASVEAETLANLLGILTLVEDQPLDRAATVSLREAIAAEAGPEGERYRFWWDAAPADD